MTDRSRFIANPEKSRKALEAFIMDAKEFKVHLCLSPAKSQTKAEKFLKCITKELRKAAARTQDIYNRNKTVANIGGMAVGFVLAGPVGVTLYSQIDKARRAHVQAALRRKEEKERLEKIAGFVAKGMKPPKDLSKKRTLYAQRPYIRFAGHLATRLVGTIALTAVAGPVLGTACSAIITTGKSVWDTHLLRDAALKFLGKPVHNDEKMADRLLNAAQTGIGVEIEKERLKKLARRLNPALLFKKRSKEK